MRILNLNVAPNCLYPHPLQLDFCTSDGVRRSQDKPLFFKSAHKIRPHLYSQVVMGVAGINATGKTTVLQIVNIVLGIVLRDFRLSELSEWLHKFQLSKNTLFSFSVIFINHKDQVYRLESKIGFDRNAYFFADEVLSEARLEEYKAWVAKPDSTTVFQHKRDRATEAANNKYLKHDISIVSAVNDCPEQCFSNFKAVNLNVNFWEGTPPAELIAIFDPSISTLQLEHDLINGLHKIKAEFLRPAVQGAITPLLPEQVLSSGTNRGLNVLPAIIEVLTKGGYFLFDDIENHFNKKIVEFILELFRDERTNPYGACLIFSTHYVELLDLLTRKDNIYVALRDAQHLLDLRRLSDYPEISRSDLLKSKIFLHNLIQGTAPKHQSLEQAKAYVTGQVRQHQEQGRSGV